MGDAAQKGAVALALLCACATARPRAQAEADILARSHAITEAQTRGDGAALDALYAPDYVYLSSTGKKDRPKADEIALQVTVKVESFSIEKPRFSWLTADAVVLHYFMDQKLRYPDGRVICPHSGAMEAWALRDGIWKIVTRSEWLIGAPPPPSCN